MFVGGCCFVLLFLSVCVFVFALPFYVVEVCVCVCVCVCRFVCSRTHCCVVGHMSIPEMDMAPGWEEMQDPATGATYYWHAETGESSWDRPVACEL